MPHSRQLRSRLRLNRIDRRELADAFYESKRTVYIETLEDLATSYGYEVAGAGVTLSPEVERALRDEAIEHATFVIESFNRDLDQFLERNQDLPSAQLIDTYESWAADRIANRAETIAVTEAYSPYTDATLAFFAENDLEPDFEFGGHEGDDPPACPVCRELVATNPHSFSRVLEIGSPHIGCRQKWHPTIEADQLPDELRLGGVVGGVLGADPLVIEAGGQDEAVAHLRSVSEPVE